MIDFWRTLFAGVTDKMIANGRPANVASVLAKEDDGETERKGFLQGG